MFAGGIAVRKTDGKCDPTHARLPADPVFATPPPPAPFPLPHARSPSPEGQREAQRQASRPATPGQASVRGPGGRPRRPRSPRAGGRSATHPAGGVCPLASLSLFARPPSPACPPVDIICVPPFARAFPPDPRPTLAAFHASLSILPLSHRRPVRSLLHSLSLRSSFPASYFIYLEWELGIGENTARSLAPYSNFGCHVIFAQSSATATSAARTHCTIQVQAHALSAVAQHSFSERIARGAVLDPK